MNQEVQRILERNELHLRCCLDLGLQPLVTLIEVKGFRWTLEYTQSPNHPDFGNGMIKLERLLQERTGRPIDLRLEAKEDKNKRVERTGRGE